MCEKEENAAQIKAKVCICCFVIIHDGGIHSREKVPLLAGKAAPVSRRITVCVKETNAAPIMEKVCFPCRTAHSFHDPKVNNGWAKLNLPAAALLGVKKERKQMRHQPERCRWR